MSPVALIIVVFFWLPPAIVVFYNIFRDVHFWQAKDYRFDRIAHHLRWDFSMSYRKTAYTYAKIVLFLILLTFITFPGSLAPIVAVVLSFALWVSEVLNIVEKYLNKRIPGVEPNMRNITLLSLAMITLALIPLVLSVYFLGINPPELSTTIAGFVPIVTATGDLLIPMTYIFLVFSTLVGITYDLGSPLISAVFVLVSSPVAWLETQFYVLVARMFLSRRPQLLTIAITGSYSKTTVKQILEHLLAKDFRVAGTPYTETSLGRLAMSLITELQPSTQVFVAELNAYRPGDMAAMTRLLQPQIVLITGIDQSHIGLFGSMENTLKTKSEILRHLAPSATVIYNGDDSLLSTIADQFANKEVYYHVRHDSHQVPEDTILEVDNYYATDITSTGRSLRFTLHNQTHELPVTVPLALRPILNSVLGAVSIAVEAGANLNHLPAALKKLPVSVLEPELIGGDNDTLLISDSRELSVKGLTHLLAHLKSAQAPQHILITTGIHELGRHKASTYSDLLTQISSVCDIVITYDRHLHTMLQANNTKVQCLLVDNTDDLIYSVRSHAVTHAAILLAGNLEPGITAALRDE